MSVQPSLSLRQHILQIWRKGLEKNVWISEEKKDRSVNRRINKYSNELHNFSLHIHIIALNKSGML